MSYLSNLLLIYQLYQSRRSNLCLTQQPVAYILVILEQKELRIASFLLSLVTVFQNLYYLSYLGIACNNTILILQLVTVYSSKSSILLLLPIAPLILSYESKQLGRPNTAYIVTYNKYNSFIEQKKESNLFFKNKVFVINLALSNKLNLSNISNILV